MSDVVVTVASRIDRGEGIPPGDGFGCWIAEGDPAGSDPSGNTYRFVVTGDKPRINPGERVWIVCRNVIRGYAPLISLEKMNRSGQVWGLIRGGGAVARSIRRRVRGFPGYRYRWWSPLYEVDFPDWMNPDGKP